MWQRRLIGQRPRGDGAGGRARDARARTRSRSSASSTGCTRPMAASARTPPPAATPLSSAAWTKPSPSSSKRFGPDSGKWQWGQETLSPRADPPPAVAGAVNDATRARLNVGPLPRGGNGDTVSATGGADNQTSGGSFKLIADTENWDNSIGLNNPGQSGNPDSPDVPQPVRDVVEGPLLPRRLLTRRRWNRSRRASPQLTPAARPARRRRLGT